MRPKTPAFSVILPTFDRPEQLARCLNALAALERPREGCEVIVVDDGSRTPLEGVVAPFHASLEITLLRQPNGGPASARNYGAARARGRFLAFTDDDCVPASDWLTTLEARFAAAPEQLIGGRTLNDLPANPYSVASQRIIDLVYAYYNARPGPGRFFATNNLALPAEPFRALGGFDAAFRTAEDRELCDRWRCRGLPMTYAPEVVVSHMHALTLRSFWRQYFHYGRGAFRFHQARLRHGTAGAMLRFYGSLLRARCAPDGRHLLPSAPLLLLWQLANASGVAWECLLHLRPRGRQRAAPSPRHVA